MRLSGKQVSIPGFALRASNTSVTAERLSAEAIELDQEAGRAAAAQVTAEGVRIELTLPTGTVTLSGGQVALVSLDMELPVGGRA